MKKLTAILIISIVFLACTFSSKNQKSDNQETAKSQSSVSDKQPIALPDPPPPHQAIALPETIDTTQHLGENIIVTIDTPQNNKQALQKKYKVYPGIKGHVIMHAHIYDTSIINK